MACRRSTGQVICLLFLPLPTAVAGEPTQLPPVLVPIPPQKVAPEAPARRDPSGSITLIEAQDYRGQAKDVSELLSAAPGVLLQDLGGLGQAKTLSIRGASSNGVLVFMDGIPLNGPGGSADLSRVPAAMIERLEVLRGAAGATYGSGGLGGAVNIVTRSPDSGEQIAAEGTVGSFGTQTGQLSASGALAGGSALVLVHGLHSRGDFPYLYNDRPQLLYNPPIELRRENNQSEIGGVLLKYRHGIAAGWVLDALADGSAESRGLAGTAENPTPDSHQSSQRIASGLRLGRRFDGGELQGRVFFRRDWVRLKGGYFAPGITEVDTAVGGECTGSALLFDRHGVSATVHLEREALHETSGANPSWWKVGLSASDEILLFAGRVSVIPSLRLDRTGPFFGVSPKLGLIARLPAGFELRSNAANGYRAPSFLELYVAQGHLLPNPLLAPERSVSIDAAVAHRSRFSSLSMGPFYSVYQDLISYEYYPPLLTRPYNIASARAWGLEAEGEIHPHVLATVSAAYTLLYSTNLRDDPRYYLKELPYRPRHKLYLRAALGPPLARARAELLYQSPEYFNRTASLALPGRAFVNLGVSSQLLARPQVTASLEIKNVGGVLAEDFDGYPLPGRSAFFTLSVALESTSSAQGTEKGRN